MTPTFLADENFNGKIVRGVIRRRPDVIIERVQDVGLLGADDPTVLEWSARRGRILLTHDVKTIGPYAYERVAASLPMPGVFEMKSWVAVAVAVEDIILIATCSDASEWVDQVRFIPL